MSDRQITAVFFPESIPAPKKAGLSRREVFWRIEQERGRTEAEIQRLWLQDQKS